TTTPLQKLFVMNSPFMVHNAEMLTQRLLSAPLDLSGQKAENIQRVELAYQWIFGRAAQDQEITLAMDYLNSGDFVTGSDDAQRRMRWQQYLHVLLASN